MEKTIGTFVPAIILLALSGALLAVSLYANRLWEKEKRLPVPRQKKNSAGLIYEISPHPYMYLRNSCRFGFAVFLVAAILFAVVRSA